MLKRECVCVKQRVRGFSETTSFELPSSSSSKLTPNLAMALQHEADDQEYGFTLLSQLYSILESDPFIDEVGFVHPSQLADLEETSLTSLDNPSTQHGKIELGPELSNRRDDGGVEGVRNDRSAFWCGNHKLAISVTALQPLYKTVKAAFLLSRHNHENVRNPDKSLYSVPFRELAEILENTNLKGIHLREKLMMYTRVLVIINSDYKSAWNTRKELLAKTMNEEVLAAELRLAGLSLSYDPKSEEAWAHRRWAILSITKFFYSGGMPELLLQEEFNLVEIVAERSRMNYRAWRHCCWLVSFMSFTQTLLALQRWKKWAHLHVADNCCFHFRRILLQHLLDQCEFVTRLDSSYIQNDNKDTKMNSRFHIDPTNRIVQVRALCKDELQWNKDLITSFVGREALWIHRRFLFYWWNQNITSSDSCSSEATDEFVSSKQAAESNIYHNCEFCCFLKEEINFADSFISICNNDKAEDQHRQRLQAAIYKLWVLLIWRQNKNCKITNLNFCEKEIPYMEELLKNLAPHWRNLWEGLFKNIPFTVI